VGPKIGVILLVVLVVVGAWVTAYYWAKSQGHLKPIERVIADYQLWPSWMGKTTKKASYTEPTVTNGIDPRDAKMAALQRQLDEQQRALDALRQQKAQPAATTKAEPAKTPPPPKARAKAVYVVNEAKPPGHPGKPLYTLAVWDYLPCVLENVLNSEIEGMFTVKLTRPVLDATRTQVLIPQGQRVGARSHTADLLVGNERIPTFALSVSLPNGSPLDLGDAPIMDASGTNGLTGEVDHHTWRLVWTSVFIRGLEGGQQAVQMQLGPNGLTPIAGGVARGSSDAATKRLGRAQDTRPTITAHSGEQCNILVTKPMQLPSFQMVQR
jgi:type IV secretory pathway VirB10-like protein